MSSQKEILVDVVKKWVQLDNQINQLNKMAKQLKQEKKTLNQDMIDVMKQNDIDIFDLKDGQIQYKKETKREPLSQKRLLHILSKHPQLGEEQAVALNEYVYSHREEVVKETIVRKINKGSD
jgi:uncharacterized protein (UPF0335 family)